MTAGLGHAPVQSAPPATARPVPAEIPQTNALVEQRLPTARVCGLGAGQATTGGTWCRDITPELMTELI
jgi:hypothetical protein